MDLNDKKILYELDRDSRQTNKQIAKKVRLSEQVVGNRIKNLVEKNVIDYFYVRINPHLLGYMHIKIYLRLQNISQEKEEELLKNMSNQNNIFWIAILRGKYDLVISIYVKNISEFTEIYENIFEKWKDYIIERNVVILEKAFTYTKVYLQEKKKSKEIIYGSMKENIVKLDNLDKSLLRLMNKNGRMSYVELANKLDVSPDTIGYRINSLKKKGVITGFGTKINFKKLGMKYHILFLKLQGMNLSKYNRLKILAMLNKNVIVYIKTIGDHDSELEIESEGDDMDMLMKDLRDNFVNEIKNYELLEVTKEYRLTYFPF